MLTLTYADGPRDAEALLVDPDDGTIVVVTKALLGAAEVWVTPPRPVGLAASSFS